MPFTRDQKDQMWDMIPDTFDIPTTEDTSDIVTFLKDTITDYKDVMVQTSFSQKPVKYPTIQIQYAEMDTRINFMNFYIGQTRSPLLFFDNNGDQTGYTNIKNNEKIFDVGKDDFDHTMQISMKGRYVDTSTSRLQFDLFRDNGSGYIKIARQIVYGWDFDVGGTFFDVFTNEKLPVTDNYRIRITSKGDGGINDLGVEIATDVSDNVIYQLYEGQQFEDHGNVENLTVSIRVVADNKPTSRAPGVGKFIESDDIADQIVRDIQSRYFKDFDDTIPEAQLIKASNIYDVTGVVSSGTSENLTARQIDFLIANLNRLREPLTSVAQLVINVDVDDSSNTLT